MPKIHKCPEQLIREARSDLTHEILMRRTDLGLRQHDIAMEISLSDSSTSELMRDLDRIRIPTLRPLIRLLGIDPITILRWLGYTDQDIKKLKEINHD